MPPDPAPRHTPCACLVTVRHRPTRTHGEPGYGWRQAARPPSQPGDHKALHVSDSNFGPPPSNFNDDDGHSGPPRRGDTATLPPARKPLVTALVVAGVLVVVLGIAAQFWTEVLWYQSVSFSSVFSTQIVTKVLLGVIGGLLTAAVVWSSIDVAYRNRPIYAPSPDTQAM